MSPQRHSPESFTRAIDQEILGPQRSPVATSAITQLERADIDQLITGVDVWWTATLFDIEVEFHSAARAGFAQTKNAAQQS